MTVARPLRLPLGVAALLLGLAGAAEAQGSSYEQLQSFSSLLNQIRTSYVDSVTYVQLVHAAIDGVLASLDPHSRFVTRADAEREVAYEAGSLAGAGVVLDEVDGSLAVLTVIPKSPGARAGVAAGDRLLTINDTAVSSLSPYEAASHLLGEKGRKVRMLFERGPRLAPDSLRVTLKYDVLEPSSIGVVALVDPVTGYLRLTGFHFKGSDEVERAVKQLQDQGAKQLILDLRGNPGGSVPAAVEIASLFFPKLTLVFRAEGRGGRPLEFFRTDRDGRFTNLPMLVLIDEGSASASEALAASLQDHDRGLLLGRRSFGKALMQQLFPVPPQGDIVWLTIGRIVTPSGRIIQRSYRGLREGQYYSLAGVGGTAADTSELFHTDHGREVRGGGGVMPDVTLPKTATLPTWFAVAADSGWYEAVSDSVAAALPREFTLARWFDARGEWQSRLVEPFLARVRGRLGIPAPADSALVARLGRILAYRTAEVRWGPKGGDDFTVHNDPDIRAAMEYWSRLPDMLAGDGRKLP